MTQQFARKAKIIFDEPASADAFDGGGHLRSAQALADTLEQLASKNGAIGLEGKWGSGKSTVIKLAEKILKDERSHYIRKYHTFTFDLWTHQSDDFRRAFLESFVNWLEDEKQTLLTKQSADKVRDKIRDRVKKVTTNNYKQYHPLGVLFILIAPFLPLLYAWLGPTTFMKGAELSAEGEWYKFYAYVVVFSLYAGFGIRFFAQFFSRSDDKWIFSKRTLTEKLSQTVTIFSKDVEREATTQNIRETDPTTVEFHSVFKELLSSVQKDKRIIFVLDNIDRLPKDSVRQVWSEIRSVFSNSSFDNRLDNPWVTAVVPYDKEFIDDVFDVKKTGPLTDVEKIAANFNAEVEGDIISKTFIRILRVSPPVATDWKKFLEGLIHEAFDPQLNEETIFKLFNLLKHDFQQKNIHPTPRRIINYVNEVSSLWTQWGDLVSTESIALFVLYRPKIENRPISIQKTELVDTRYQRIAGVSDWQKDFAALAFNVNPDLAYQVLLKQPIAKALVEEASEELIDLAKAKGFVEIFQEVLEENISTWIGEGSAIVSNVASNIAGLKLGGEVEFSAWRTMASSLDKLEEINIQDEDTIKGFLEIIRGQNKNSIVRVANLVRDVINNYTAVVKENDPTMPKNWVQIMVGISDVLAEVLDKKSKENFIKGTQFPQGGRAQDFYLGVARECVTRKDINVKDFYLNLHKSEILEAYGQFIESSPTLFLFCEGQVSHLFDDEIRKSYIDRIGNKLRTSTFEEKDTVALINAYRRIFSAADKEKVQSSLNALVEDGTLAWQGLKLKERGNETATSSLMALNTNVWGNNATPPIPDNHPHFGKISAAKSWYQETLGQYNFTDEDVSKIARFVTSNDHFSEWIKYAIQDNSPNKIFLSVIKKIIPWASYGSLNVKEGVTRYPGLKRIVGDELALTFLKKFGDWHAHYEKTFAGNAILEIPNDFITDASTLDKGMNAREILEMLDKHLKGLTKEDWEVALKAEDNNFRLLVCRRITGDINLTVEMYRPALISHALSVLREEVKPAKSVQEWTYILEALKPASRKVLAEDIFNKLSGLTLEVGGVESFIKVYGEIASHMPFTSDADKALGKIFAKIIYSTDEVIKKFLNDNAQAMKKCYQSANDISKQNFEEALEGLEDNGSVEQKEWSKKLREITGLKPRKLAANDETASDDNDENSDKEKA